MPRIFGVNLIGLLLAAVAMFFVGFIFYGALFSDIWMAARGYTVDMATDANPAWMGAGFLISLILSFGIGYGMKKRDIKGLVPAIRFAVTLALLIGFPILAYDFVYGMYHSVPGLMVDWGHTLVGFVASAAVLSFFD